MTGSPFPPYYYHTPSIAKKHGFMRYWAGAGTSIYVNNKQTVIVFTDTGNAVLVQFYRDEKILEEFYLDELAMKRESIREAIGEIFEIAAAL